MPPEDLIVAEGMMYAVEHGQPSADKVRLGRTFTLSLRNLRRSATINSLSVGAYVHFARKEVPGDG